MTKEQLVAELNTLNVSPDQYNIGFPAMGAAMNLVYHEGCWKMYYLGDPSGPSDIREFATESEAFDALLALFQKTYNYTKRDVQSIMTSLFFRTLFDNSFWPRLFSEHDLNVPGSIRGFYRVYDGFYGRVGANSKVDFWKASVALSKNKEINPDKASGLFYLGENINGERYALSRAEVGILSVKNGNILHCANDFDDLLFYLFDI